MKKEDIKRWTQIFKALSNPNRLAIIKMLYKSEPMTVGDIAYKLEISVKATSKHLILLSDLDVLNSTGQQNRVFYSFNAKLPGDAKRAVDLFL